MSTFYCTFDMLTAEEVLERKRELATQLQFEPSEELAELLHDQILGLDRRLKTFAEHPEVAPQITTL